MEYITLPNSELKVSQVCMGCWQFNNNEQSGDKTWNAQPYEVSKQIVDKALELGINFFDTAEAYLNSEKVLGRILEGRRKDVVIASKFGARLSEVYTPQDIEQSLMTSLQRLRTDYIDLYQIHWPTFVDLANPAGFVAELKRLQAKGLIRHYGLCNFGPQNMKDILAAGAQPITNQVPYSLLWRAVEFDIIPMCQQNNIGLLTYSSLQQGLLTGKYRKPEDVPEGRRRCRLFNASSTELSRHGGVGAEKLMFETLGDMRVVCEKADVSMPVAALSWCFAQPIVKCTIMGASSPEQVEKNVKLVNMPKNIVDDLNAATEKMKQSFGNNIDLWAETSRVA